MDNKLFLKRLSEVSDWYRGDSANYHKDNKKLVSQPPVYTEVELAEMSDEEAEELYEWVMAWREQQPNEGLPPLIKTVKIQAKDCEDCGRHCPNGRRTEHKLCQTGVKHWRHRCTECSLYRDPSDGSYSLDAHGVHQYLCSYYRPTLKGDKHGPKAKPKVKTKESIVKLRAKERLKQMMPKPEEQYQMTPYDNGESIVYVREPISKD